MSKSDKPRNAQAVAAWSRHGGAHNPGSKRPTRDESTDIAEGIDEALEEAETDFLSGLLSGVLVIDGEEYEVEWDWDDEGDDDE